MIFDLEPAFRVIYDSNRLDSGNDVGNELVPVDIDGDGIFEFFQDVMAFDYMAPGGHATSTFPPAVFAYDKNKGRYDFANKRFSNFVIEKLQENLEGHDEWVRECAKYGSHISTEDLNEIIARETFLYKVYAGNEKEAWTYFEQNYNFEFKDKFRTEFREQFAEDPTYRSIYR